MLLLPLLFKNNRITFFVIFTKNGCFWTAVDFQTFETLDHHYTRRNTWAPILHQAKHQARIE